MAHSGLFRHTRIGACFGKADKSGTQKAVFQNENGKIAQQFILAIIKFLLYLVLVLVLFSVIGVEITGILTALSAALLAVGMALENNIANLANGIVIVSGQMFKRETI